MKRERKKERKENKNAKKKGEIDLPPSRSHMHTKFNVQKIEKEMEKGRKMKRMIQLP